MKRVDSSKQKREKAEKSIIDSMREIQQNLHKHKSAQSENIDKNKIKSILTKFLELKQTKEMH